MCIAVLFLFSCSSSRKNKRSSQTESTSTVSESSKEVKKSTTDSLAETKLKEGSSTKDESTVQVENEYTKLDIDSGTIVILPEDLKDQYAGVNDDKGKRTLLVPKGKTTSNKKKEETKSSEKEQKTQTSKGDSAVNEKKKDTTGTFKNITKEKEVVKVSLFNWWWLLLLFLLLLYKPIRLKAYQFIKWVGLRTFGIK